MKYRIFISSVQREFVRERKALAEYIRRQKNIDAPANGTVCGTVEKTIQKTTQEITQKTAQKILSLVNSHPRITREELAKLCEISPDGIKWQLNRLKARGLIRRVGPDKGGHWEIVKE